MAYETAHKQVNESSNKVGSLKDVIAQMEDQFRKNALLVLKSDDMEHMSELLEAVVTETEASLMAIKEQIKEEQKRSRRKEELAKLLPEKEKKIEQYAEEITNLKTEICALEAKNKADQEKIKEIRESLTFESCIMAKKEQTVLEKKCKELQDGYEKADQNYRKIVEEISTLSGKAESYRMTLEKAESINIEEQKSVKVQLEENMKEISAKQQSIHARQEANEKARINIMSKSDELSTLEKRLQWMKALADTANGKLTGKSRIMLETYIQTTYFDRIINRANLRLFKMSNAQYELKRMTEADDNRSKSGLELGVIDHYNGTERSVKTLSGGESFMASLSLALGLSDEVQASAGGIQINTMFVDEGFGSLDPDSLDQAYKALIGLTEGNRLVGIISHVADLKDKIDRQIVVTKEKSGGSKIKVQV